MIRKILIHSYLQLINNSKITTLVLTTLFAHSLIFVFVIVFNAYIYAEQQFDLNTSNQVIQYIMGLFQLDNIGWFSLGLGIFLFFGYFVFSPIGEYAIVHHIHTDERLAKCLGKGFNNFHHIAKFEGMVFVFNIVVFINLASKIFLYEVNNGIIFGFLVIWLCFIAFVSVTFQYAKTVIVLEGLTVFDAIKTSISLSFEHLRTTLKLVGISLLFNIRLIFNVLFIVGIPLALIIILEMLGIVGGLADALVYILFFGLLLFLAYINTLIEGYFRIFWYISYEYITDNTEQLEKLGIIRISKEQGLGGLFGGDAKDTVIHHDVDEMKLLEGS